MHLNAFEFISFTILFSFVSCNGARISSHKMKVVESKGMFIVRHGKAIEESKLAKNGTLPINIAEDFSEWSPWSKCRKRCKQVRVRVCKATSCGSTILREERDCSGHRCALSIAANNDQMKQRKRKQRPQIDDDRVSRAHRKHRRQQHQQRGRSRRIRVLYHLQRYIYSPWSEWSTCKTRTCHTTRYRVCMNSVICQNSIIKEDALCYTPGSDCEKQYKPQLDQADLELLEKIEPENQVITSNDERGGGGSGSGSSSISSKDDNGFPFDDGVCGIASRHANLGSMLRIIGGRRARQGRWPWMMAILNRHKQHFCGGTLVAPQFVITAAHCVKHHLYVRAGEHNFAVDEGTEQEVSVAATFIHPEYDNFTVDNDIALLKLQTPLEIDDYVSPICLPSIDDSMEVNKNGTILGWGKKRNSDMFGTQVLQEARVPIADIDDCKKVYENYRITENMVCAGYKKGKTDSCAGDSGGPLMFRKRDANKRNRWHLYGITSFGEGCGKKGKYGIYAKVPKLVSWIRRTIQNGQPS